MKTRKLGEMFEHPTMGTLKVVESVEHSGCFGCVFQSSTTPFCRNDIEKVHSGECSFERREDRTDVIFVKAKGENDD